MSTKTVSMTFSLDPVGVLPKPQTPPEPVLMPTPPPPPLPGETEPKPQNLAEATEKVKRHRKSSKAVQQVVAPEAPAPSPKGERVEAPAVGRRRRQSETVMTLPAYQDPVFSARTITLYPGLDVLIDEGGFWQSDGQTGVVGVSDDGTGEKEVRVPLTYIKALFRVQYVYDMQAEHPAVAAEHFTVYFQSSGYSFMRVSRKQFEVLEVMLPQKYVDRRYTYMDLADNKRAYTFEFPDFPTHQDQLAYNLRNVPISRRRFGDYDKEPEVKVTD